MSIWMTARCGIYGKIAAEKIKSKNIKDLLYNAEKKIIIGNINQQIKGEKK